MGCCMSLLIPQHRFQPHNPLSAAQPFSPREAGGEEEELRLSAHTLLLPTRGQLEARMMVTAFELGLDNITEDAVSTMICAVEVCCNCLPGSFCMSGYGQVRCAYLNTHMALQQHVLNNSVGHLFF